MTARLTPHQQRVLELLDQGLVLRSLQGGVQYGLFRPGERLAGKPYVLPETIRLLGERLAVHDRRTGEPLPEGSPLRTPGIVEYRLAPPQVEVRP